MDLMLAYAWPQMVSSSEQDATLQLAEARAKRLAQSLQESEAEVSSLKSRLQASVSKTAPPPPPPPPFPLPPSPSIESLQAKKSS